MPKLLFKAGAIFNKNIRELLELLPRYKHDNLFDDLKFRHTFPNFKITSYSEEIEIIKNEHKNY